jgi:hypothetical protein
MTTPHPAPGVRTVIGVDAGSASLREADHLVHGLAASLGLTAETVACTHLVRTADRPATAVSLALPDPEAAEAAWERLIVLLADSYGPAAVGAVLGEREYGPPPAVRCAALAAAEHAARSGGRAVLYPGAERLTGTITLAELLARSAIDDVVTVGAPQGTGAGTDAATRILTRDHVRPQWRDGRLALALTPAAGGMLAPFEVPNPTPCCADHS